MRKPLQKAFTTFASLALALGFVQPAQAVDTFVAPVRLAETIPEYAPVIVTPLPNGTSSVIWVNGYSLASGIIRPDGALVETTLIGAYGDNQIYLSEQQGLTILPDGTLAVTWSRTYTNYSRENPFSKSVVQVSYSADAKEWSLPIDVFDDYITSDPTCFFDDITPLPQCGYSTPIIESDGLGRVAISASKSFGSLAHLDKLLVKISVDEVNFTAPTELYGGEVLSQTIKGLSSGGFLAVWSQVDGPNISRVFSSQNIVGSRSTWRAAKLVADVPSGNPEFDLEQSSPNSFTLLYDNAEINSVAIVRRNFSTTTSSWSDAEAVAAQASGFIDPGAIKLAFQGNKFAATFSIGILSQQLSVQYQLEIIAGVAQQTHLIFSTPDQHLMANAMQITGDGTVMTAWSGRYTDPYISFLKTGDSPVTRTIETPLTTPGVKAGISTTGNAFIIAKSDSGSDRYITIYQGAEMPIASGAASYSGTQKVGSKLTARTVLFESLSGIGTTTRQWYSCSRAVPASTTVKPSTCSAISKATGSTFKVTSKQRGRYITVAVKNTNSVGTTTLFAPVSSKAK